MQTPLPTGRAGTGPRQADVTMRDGKPLRLISTRRPDGSVVYRLTGPSVDGAVTVQPVVEWEPPAHAEMEPGSVWVEACERTTRYEPATGLTINGVQLSPDGYLVRVAEAQSWRGERNLLATPSRKHYRPGRNNRVPGGVALRWNEVVHAVVTDWLEHHDPPRRHAEHVAHVAPYRAECAAGRAGQDDTRALTAARYRDEQLRDRAAWLAFTPPPHPELTGQSLRAADTLRLLADVVAEARETDADSAGGLLERIGGLLPTTPIDAEETVSEDP